MTTVQPERPCGAAPPLPRPTPPTRPKLQDHIDRAEAAAINLARRIGLPAMRIALGLTFIWFGALKITNDTPVAEFVANTVNWLPLVEGSWFVPFLGVVEVLLGGALVLGKALRAVLPLLFAHLTGTFLALVTQPDVAFQNGNLLMLTTEGEFVIKNLILLSGVLILYAAQHVRGTAPTPAR
jgi:putative oxidoreductase